MTRNHETDLIGISPAIARLREEIEQIRMSDAKVLITGDSGVGKDLVAKAIHRNSLRASRPFVPVNCAGLSETLLESELFGHVKGSFTGAYRDKSGTFELADQGTVFLDEVGEMTPRMQALLLRFLETGEIQKVGSDRRAGRVNVRIIAATNRNLSDSVARGLFREDLFYRLNVIHIVVPTLRERREDVPVLIEHFLKQFMANGHCRVTSVTDEAMAALREYSWPGNVRELLNVLERLVVATRREIADVDDLPPHIRVQRQAVVRPGHERRRSIADDLYERIIGGGESFWSVVYPLYMDREITGENVRQIVRRGLEEARGNYKIVVRLFNMDTRDYKKFLNFLRKHGCQVSFREYRGWHPNEAQLRFPPVDLAHARGINRPPHHGPSDRSVAHDS